MTRAIALDTCVLGCAANPNAKWAPCRQWITDAISASVPVLIPSIADYEVRRSLILHNLAQTTLDILCGQCQCIELTEAALRLGARDWATLRKPPKLADAMGHRLDADVLICAQTRAYALAHGLEVVIATDNVADFLPLCDDVFVVDARPWQDIAN